MYKFLTYLVSKITKKRARATNLKAKILLDFLGLFFFFYNFLYFFYMDALELLVFGPQLKILTIDSLNFKSVLHSKSNRK